MSLRRLSVGSGEEYRTPRSTIPVFRRPGCLYITRHIPDIKKFLKGNSHFRGEVIEHKRVWLGKGYFFVSFLVDCLLHKNDVVERYNLFKILPYAESFKRV